MKIMERKIWFLTLVLMGSMVLSAYMPCQLLKTKLHVTVRNELGNIVEGAKIQLFVNREDYDASKNQIDTKVTDKKGIAVFSDLDEKVYFVNVEKGAANNFDAATQTDTLRANRTNKVTIIISE